MTRLQMLSEYRSHLLANLDVASEWSISAFASNNAPCFMVKALSDGKKALSMSSLSFAPVSIDERYGISMTCLQLIREGTPAVLRYLDREIAKEQEFQLPPSGGESLDIEPLIKASRAAKAAAKTFVMALLTLVPR